MKGAELRDILSKPWVFGEAADLKGVIIEDALDLSGLKLCGFDLAGSRFEGPVTAKHTHFQGLSWFEGAEFQQDVDFSAAQFDNDAKFEAAIFEGRRVLLKPSFAALPNSTTRAFDHKRS